MATSLSQRYKKKKESSLQRGIPFELTFNQWKVYIDYMKDGQCDYTGVKFGTGDLAGSIERIDKNGPYSINNCCVVTIRANQLKDVIVDESGRTRLSLEELDTMKQIKEKLDSGYDFSLKYKQKLGLEAKPMITNTAQQTTTVKHSDHHVAKEYVEFSNKHNVSFTAFKKAFTRTTCAVSKRPFTNDMHHRMVITSKDLSPEITDANIIAVCTVVYHVMKAGLTAKELKGVL